MARRVSALYASRALADEAAVRIASAFPGHTPELFEQRGDTAAELGVFDRLATLLTPDGARANGFIVAMEVAADRMDAAAMALEAGAERVEISAPPRLADQVIELSEGAEELVVEKQSVVREEIVMRVQASTRVQEVSDTVRRTEVDVERFGPDA